MALIGVVGGSGLYEIEGLAKLSKVEVNTPFGPPSSPILLGTLDGIEIAFLPRHGETHSHAPHELPLKANVWALKSLGVKWVLSVSAVGSLQEAIAPGDVVLIDQFIDRTKRTTTFYEDGIVAHVSMADPVCPELHKTLQKATEVVLHDSGNFHQSGTYVCIEGPQFSSRAESHLYRSWGASVVGMTNYPEARLFREAEIAYATMAMVTDYDCWYEAHGDVSVKEVLETMKENVDKAKAIIRKAVPMVSKLKESIAFSAMEHAIMTAPHAISESQRKDLALLIDHRLP